MHQNSIFSVRAPPRTPLEELTRLPQTLSSRLGRGTRTPHFHTHRRRNVMKSGTAQVQPIMGVWGQCPQRGPGAEPLKQSPWSGGQPKAFALLASNGMATLAPFLSFVVYMFSRNFYKTAYRSVLPSNSSQCAVPCTFLKVFHLLL